MFFLNDNPRQCGQANAFLAELSFFKLSCPFTKIDNICLYWITNGCVYKFRIQHQCKVHLKVNDTIFKTNRNNGIALNSRQQ